MSFVLLGRGACHTHRLACSLICNLSDVCIVHSFSPRTIISSSQQYHLRPERMYRENWKSVTISYLVMLHCCSLNCLSQRDERQARSPIRRNGRCRASNGNRVASDYQRIRRPALETVIGEKCVRAFELVTNENPIRHKKRWTGWTSIERRLVVMWGHYTCFWNDSSHLKTIILS